MFNCDIFACEKMCLDKYNTIEFTYMVIAMWKFKISMNFYMKLCFEQ